MVLSQILGIVAIICAVWVIYDVLAVNKKLSSGMKVVWIIAALLFSIVTAVVYYFLNKR